jgi:hypothetical protein
MNSIKIFPLKLCVTAIVAIAMFIAASLWIVYPLSLKVIHNVAELSESYSNSNKSVLDSVEQQRTLLLNMEKNIKKSESSLNQSAATYDYLQEVLNQQHIQAVKITGGAEETTATCVHNDYTVKLTDTYHPLGQLINSLENSPYIGEIKSLHIIAHSLMSNIVDVELEVSFYRTKR